jgi:hypothetical protein
MARQAHTRRTGSFQTPVRCLIAFRPGDQFTIVGLATTFLKIGLASLLVRALVAAGAILTFLVLAAIVYAVR